MKYLITRKEHFKNERLSKYLKTTTIGNFDELLNFNTLNEILNSNLITNYKILSNDNEELVLIFESKSKIKYQLNLFKRFEYGEIVNHIVFTLYGREEKDFESLSGKNEMIEILNRVKYILISMVNDMIINDNFCIGGSILESKNNIYEYALYIFVGEEGYEKLDTIYYPTGWGLYFKSK